MDQYAKRFGILAALAALGICWGATIPLTKIAVSTGHHPMGLIFWQLVIGVIVLSVVTLLRRVRFPVNRRTVLQFLVVALIGTLLPNTFSFVAAVHLPAGILAIIIASVPMFSLIIALGFRLERISIMRLAGVVLGALAVVLLIGPETSLPEPEKAIFVLVALAAPVCYGMESNYLAVRSPAGLDPVATLLGASVLGALIAAPIALASGGFVDLSQPWSKPEWALLLSSLFHAIAYTGYIWLVGVAGAVFASQIAYVVTIAGVLISALALGENYSGWVWAALVLMIGGMALVQPRQAVQAAE